MANRTKDNFFEGSKRRTAASNKSQEPANVSTADDSQSTDVMAEIRKISATLQVVATDVVAIKETTKELKDAMEKVQVRLGAAEQRISDIEDMNTRVEKVIEKHDKKLETLWSRVEDLENRSRRNNVRMVGLKENKEQRGGVQQYVERILSEGLGLAGQEFEIERAHRAMGPMPDPDKAPRTIMIRFLRSTARDKVLQVSKEKRGIKWENCKLSFFEDLTRELAETRRGFTAAKKRLQELNVKHRLAYPATLIFTWKGERKAFREWKEAESFIQKET